MMKYLFALCTIFLLTACNTLIPRQEAAVDLQTAEQHADTAYQSQDWYGAEQAYQDLASRSPSNAEYWFRLGNIYARTDRLDEAVNAYRQALESDPENSSIWHNLGIVQLRQATTTFIDLVNHTPDDDPLNQRARYVVINVTRLMEDNFDTEAEQENIDLQSTP